MAKRLQNQIGDQLVVLDPDTLQVVVSIEGEGAGVFQTTTYEDAVRIYWICCGTATDMLKEHKDQLNTDSINTEQSNVETTNGSEPRD